MVRHTNPDAESSDKSIDPDDVDFDAHAIAAAWEAGDDVPVCVAVAITNEFTNLRVSAFDGEKSDGDVVFDKVDGDMFHKAGTPDVLFEEKAVGVCYRGIAERYAPMYVELNREDNKVLAVNPAQIFDRR